MSYIGEYRPQTNLLGGYRLADLNDYSGNDATLTNAAVTTFVAVPLPDGLAGKCANLVAASSQYLHSEDADLGIDLSANAATVAGWIYLATLPSASVYPTAVHWESNATTRRDIALWYLNDGGTYKLQGYFSGTTISYTVSLVAETWYWVVLTQAAGVGSAIALYLNGALVASGAKGTTNGGDAKIFQLGKHIAQAQYWNGKLYNFAVYSKAFTATEILAWYDYMVGTAYADPHIEIAGTELTSIVLADSSIVPAIGSLMVTAVPTPTREFPTLTHTGRDKSLYRAVLASNNRATLDTLFQTIHGIDELDLAEFFPMSNDRCCYIFRAWASMVKPLRRFMAGAYEWYYRAELQVIPIDGLLFGPKKIVYNGFNVPTPTEIYTVTNNGTYRSTLDEIVLSGFFDSGPGNCTEDVILSFAGKTIILCDRMLQGDELRMDRYGRVQQSYYTDFLESYANMQSYIPELEETSGVDTAGYILGGSNPRTNNHDKEDWYFYIKVDAESSWALCELATPDDDTTGNEIAADMQGVIRAKAGAYAAVSVIYSGGRYKVTSGTTGAGSKVRIRDACDYDGINWGDLVMRLKLCTEFSDEAEHEWSDHELDEYRGDYYDGTGAATSKSVFYGDSSYGLHTSAEQPSICITGQGYHVGGANPATSLSSSSTTKFKITCDACTTPHIITLANYPRTTGVLVASEMQSKIQALGTCAHAGIFTKVQVKYENGRYKIFSGTIGAASNIRITAGDDHDVSAVLKIGVANGGEEFDGSATEKNEFSLVADAEAATTVTLTLYQPFTNDPASGSNITLNMVDTSMFALNDVVIVSSSAGSEYATVNLITDNVSIRVASLSLNHTLTNPCVYWGFYGAQIARNMQKYIRAIGAAYDAITVVYSNGKYIITSETSGTLSKIHITSDPSNDIADRLKIGTANGGVDTDGTGPSWTQNACVITQNGVILIPLFGPLLIWSAYLEINVTALTGSPKACFWVDENVGLETLSNEITLGYNKLWFPDTQGYGTIYLGIRCPEGSSITLYDMNFVVRRDLSQEELEFIEPADTGAISLVAGGSAKFSKCEAYFRDAYWS